MAQPEDPVIVPIQADFSGFSDAMKDLQKQTNRFGAAFTSTISSAIRRGKSFEDTLKSLALRLSDIALQSALKPLEDAASNFVGQAVGALANTAGNAMSGAGGGGSNVQPFAKGGVVSAPKWFTSGSSLGVAGEAGSEAIMPLSRGANGKLGVEMHGAGQPVHVTFNVTTPDVAGFKKSEGQLSAMLARTVGRGRRSL